MACKVLYMFVKKILQAPAALRGARWEKRGEERSNRVCVCSTVLAVKPMLLIKISN